MFVSGKRRDSKDVRRAESLPKEKENTSMHDLLIALAFVAMVIAPALVAARSGAADTEENA
jgi:uncharacterized protein YraI